MRDKQKREKSELRWWKRAVFVIPFSIAIAFGGIAAAFFISDGHGTGNTQVQTANEPAVQAVVVQPVSSIQAEASNGGPLSPTTDAGIRTGDCNCISDAGWSVEANNSDVSVSSLVATVASSGGYVEDANNGDAR